MVTPPQACVTSHKTVHKKRVLSCMPIYKINLPKTKVLFAMYMLHFSAIPKRHGLTKGIPQGSVVTGAHDGWQLRQQVGGPSSLTTPPPTLMWRMQTAGDVCFHPSFAELCSPLLCIGKTCDTGQARGKQGNLHTLLALLCPDLAFLDCTRMEKKKASNSFWRLVPGHQNE